MGTLHVSMEKSRRIAFLLLVLTAVNFSCQSKPPEPAGSPNTTANPRTGPPSDLCSLFTVDEIKDLLDAPVEAGRVAGPLGTACHWSGSTDATAIYAQIQVIKDTNYWNKPTLGQGYEAVSGIGKEAYVLPEAGGWAAGALTDNAVLGVAVNGGTANRDTAVKLLRTLLERSK
jgi:hypothetical protein